MMRLKIALVLGLMSPLTWTTSSPASTLWLNFSGWNHTAITTGGQTFLGILPGIDVTVTGTPNGFLASTNSVQGIRTGVNVGSQQFAFSFSAPVPLVVDVQSLDRFETLTVTTGGPVSYTHNVGAVPNMIGNLTLMGNGVGLGPTGAARGLLSLGTVSSFVWDYSSGRGPKYERFRVGSEVIPEPAVSLPLGLIAAGLLIQGRRTMRTNG
ncbi:MAG TPA: hypothetical protein VIY86_08855 [Pirellulaceae bacterium]